MKPTRKIAGFTLVEILTVLIIIGILSAAALAKYQNWQTRIKAETAQPKTPQPYLLLQGATLDLEDSLNQQARAGYRVVSMASPSNGYCAVLMARPDLLDSLPASGVVTR